MKELSNGFGFFHTDRRELHEGRCSEADDPVTQHENVCSPRRFSQSLRKLWVAEFACNPFANAFKKWARVAANEECLVWLDAKGNPSSRLTYGDLNTCVRRLGYALKYHLNLKLGERVALCFPPGLDFVIGFFACVCAGLVAVPVYPPDPTRLDLDLPKFLNILGAGDVAYVLTNAFYRRAVLAMSTFVKDGRWKAIRWAVSDSLIKKANEASESFRMFEFPSLCPEALAFLQFTSGSTSDPKGVMVSYGALLHNCHLCIVAFRFDQAPVLSGMNLEEFDRQAASLGEKKKKDIGEIPRMVERNHVISIASLGHRVRCFSWLPVYHDMGLIGSLCTPLLYGGCVYQMSPVDFVRDPCSWIRCIGQYQCAASAAPNFAFGLLVRKMSTQLLKTLQLQHVVGLICGAEPVKAQTMLKFLGMFEKCKLSRGAMLPAYGLAEHSLIVTAHSGTRECSFIAVDAQILDQEGRALIVVEAVGSQFEEKLRHAERDYPTHRLKTFVSCGKPVLDVDVRIVSVSEAIELPECHLGLIYVRSDSLGSGYYNDPVRTREVFNQTCRLLKRERNYNKTAPVGEIFKEEVLEGYLRTGDYGFFYQQELYIVGREKDVIILNGRKYYPQDVEGIVEENKSVRPGCSAGFSFDVQGREVLGIAAELSDSVFSSLTSEIGAQVAGSFSKRLPFQGVWNFFSGKGLFSGLSDEKAAMVPESLLSLERAICSAITRELQVPVGACFFLKPRSIPKTSSGKIRRSHTQKVLSQGISDCIVYSSVGGVKVLGGLKSNAVINTAEIPRGDSVSGGHTSSHETIPQVVSFGKLGETVEASVLKSEEQSLSNLASRSIANCRNADLKSQVMKIVEEVVLKRLMAEAASDDSDAHQMESEVSPLDLKAVKERLGEALYERTRSDLRRLAKDESLPLYTLGFDSVAAVEFSERLSEIFKVELSSALLFQYPTFGDLLDYLSGVVSSEGDKAVILKTSSRTVAGTASQATSFPVKSETIICPPSLKWESRRKNCGTRFGIGVTAVACRFPGGLDNPHSFWEALSQKADVITEIPLHRWVTDEYYSPEKEGFMYVREGGFLEDAAVFDAAFFGVSQPEAMVMDPQQRQVIEVGYEVLHQRGYRKSSLLHRKIGVFVGCCTDDWPIMQRPDVQRSQQSVKRGRTESSEKKGFDMFCHRRDSLIQAGVCSPLLERSDTQATRGPDWGSAYSAPAVSLAMLSNRISFCFGLVGPSMTLNTACSSSLVAIDVALHHMWEGLCDDALVAGVNMILSPMATVLLCQAKAMSPDGRCKAFSALADGYVRSEGVAAILLERLSCSGEACTTEVVSGGGISVLPPITPLCEVLGCSVNHGGKAATLVAPVGHRQADVLNTAFKRAGVHPDRFCCLEAHGTGTRLGDVIEVTALNSVFGTTTRQQPLLVGSIKSNIGHTEGAAGLAGFLKIALSLLWQKLPGTTHLERLNPLLRVAPETMAFPSTLTPLGPPGEPSCCDDDVYYAVAGVSSFGFGGTNAHVVMGRRWDFAETSGLPELRSVTSGDGEPVTPPTQATESLDSVTVSKDVGCLGKDWTNGVSAAAGGNKGQLKTQDVPRIGEKLAWIWRESPEHFPWWSAPVHPLMGRIQLLEPSVSKPQMMENLLSIQMTSTVRQDVYRLLKDHSVSGGVPVVPGAVLLEMLYVFGRKVGVFLAQENGELDWPDLVIESFEFETPLFLPEGYDRVGTYLERAAPRVQIKTTVDSGGVCTVASRLESTASLNWLKTQKEESLRQRGLCCSEVNLLRALHLPSNYQQHLRGRLSRSPFGERADFSQWHQFLSDGAKEVSTGDVKDDKCHSLVSGIDRLIGCLDDAVEFSVEEFYNESAHRGLCLGKEFQTVQRLVAGRAKRHPAVEAKTDDCTGPLVPTMVVHLAKQLEDCAESRESILENTLRFLMHPTMIDGAMQGASALIYVDSEWNRGSSDLAGSLSRRRLSYVHVPVAGEGCWINGSASSAEYVGSKQLMYQQRIAWVQLIDSGPQFGVVEISVFDSALSQLIFHCKRVRFQQIHFSVPVDVPKACIWREVLEPAFIAENGVHEGAEVSSGVSDSVRVVSQSGLSQNAQAEGLPAIDAYSIVLVECKDSVMGHALQSALNRVIAEKDSSRVVHVALAQLEEFLVLQSTWNSGDDAKSGSEECLVVYCGAVTGSVPLSECSIIQEATVLARIVLQAAKGGMSALFEEGENVPNKTIINGNDQERISNRFKNIHLLFLGRSNLFAKSADVGTETGIINAKDVVRQRHSATSSTKDFSCLPSGACLRGFVRSLRMELQRFAQRGQNHIVSGVSLLDLDPLKPLDTQHNCVLRFIELVRINAHKGQGFRGEGIEVCVRKNNFYAPVLKPALEFVDGQVMGRPFFVIVEDRLEQIGKGEGTATTIDPRVKSCLRLRPLALKRTPVEGNMVDANVDCVVVWDHGVIPIAHDINKDVLVDWLTREAVLGPSIFIGRLTRIAPQLRNLKGWSFGDRIIGICERAFQSTLRLDAKNVVVLRSHLRHAPACCVAQGLASHIVQAWARWSTDKELVPQIEAVSPETGSLGEPCSTLRIRSPSSQSSLSVWPFLKAVLHEVQSLQCLPTPYKGIAHNFPCSPDGCTFGCYPLIKREGTKTAEGLLQVCRILAEKACGRQETLEVTGTLGSSDGARFSSLPTACGVVSLRMDGCDGSFGAGCLTALALHRTVVITGGLGGLGLLVALWLVEQGYQHVVLLSRGSVEAKREALVVREEWVRLTGEGAVEERLQCRFPEREKVEYLYKRKGYTLACLVCDASDLGSLMETFVYIQDVLEFPTITGVYHCGGVVEDKRVEDLTPDAIERVFNAKFLAAVNLCLVCDQMNLNETLEDFVVFSSVVAAIGSVGQTHYAAANAAIDSLMAWRRELCLPALSLQWGPWIQQGMASHLSRLFSSAGFTGITNDLGLRLLDELLPLGRRETTFSYRQSGHEGPVICTQFEWKGLVERWETDARDWLWETGGGPEPAIFMPIYLRRVKQTVKQALLGKGTAMHGDTGVAQQSAFIASLVPLNESERADRVRTTMVAEVLNVLGGETYSEDTLPLHEPLVNLGLDSLGAIELRNALGQKFGLHLSATALFDYPTLDVMQAYLMKEINTRLQHADRGNDAEQREPQSNSTTFLHRRRSLPSTGPFGAFSKPRERWAIVGLACRLPGASDTIEGFWEMLMSGRCCVTEVPLSRFNPDAIFDPNPDALGCTYVREGAFIRDAEGFDNGLFSISVAEVLAMDPQQRVMLEVASATFADAGLSRDAVRHQPYGVFIGCCNNDWHYMPANNAPLRASPYSCSGGSNCLMSNRVSFSFGLTGPSLTVDTACSSSLVAVDIALRKLAEGTSCMGAFLGGVNLMLSPHLFIGFAKTRMLSPQCRCRTFDSEADGYVRGEGVVGVFVVPAGSLGASDPLPWGYLLGSAVNHVGRSSTLTAPNGPAQQRCIMEAVTMAEVHPSAVAVVECHGTGTPLGDPIEAGALAAVFGPSRRKEKPRVLSVDPLDSVEDEDTHQTPLVLGALKTNIGHLEGSAGVAGLLKLILCLASGQVPPNLHFKRLNPHVDFHNMNVVYSDTTQQLKKTIPQSGRSVPPLVGGVSSFGFGGSNAHVIVEAAREADGVLPVRYLRKEDVICPPFTEGRKRFPWMLAPAHPFLGRRLHCGFKNPDTGVARGAKDTEGVVVFSTALRQDVKALIAHHMVLHVKQMPGAWFIEMVVAAALALRQQGPGGYDSAFANGSYNGTVAQKSCSLRECGFCIQKLRLLNPLIVEPVEDNDTQKSDKASFKAPTHVRILCNNTGDVAVVSDHTVVLDDEVRVTQNENESSLTHVLGNVIWEGHPAWDSTEIATWESLARVTDVFSSYFESTINISEDDGVVRLDRFQKECCIENTKDLYKEMYKAGYHYGLRFQVLERLYIDQKESAVIARLCVKDFDEVQQGCVASPVLIDGAFQSVTALAKFLMSNDANDEDESQVRKIYVPVRVSGVHMCSPRRRERKEITTGTDTTAKIAWSYAKLRQPGASLGRSTSIRFTVTLFSETFEPFCHIHEVVVKEVATNAATVSSKASSSLVSANVSSVECLYWKTRREPLALVAIAEENTEVLPAPKEHNLDHCQLLEKTTPSSIALFVLPQLLLKRKDESERTRQWMMDCGHSVVEEEVFLNDPHAYLPEYPTSVSLYYVFPHEVSSASFRRKTIGVIGKAASSQFSTIVPRLVIFIIVLHARKVYTR